MEFRISFIIPVFNRPDEVEELLQSFKNLKTQIPFEVIIVEDGSTRVSKPVVDRFVKDLDMVYFFKDNSGPGDSRNYGMSHAKGNYFIILDSDCVLPKDYLYAVITSLTANYTDCFGGPDAAHSSFTPLQKAIDFSMTSLISTGGIRGKKNSVNTFQPRSFNMGISKKAFEASGGFGCIHPGEDPDLSIRLGYLGFTTKLIPEAFVYHKRRVSWTGFYNQVYKFGMVRPILNKWHPTTKRLTYSFPTLFCVGLIASVVLLFFDVYWSLSLYFLYFIGAFVLALFSTKQINVALLSLPAILIQFVGYGFGYLKSTTAIVVLKQKPERRFPELFFKLK